jgi:hypothetical protein
MLLREGFKMSTMTNRELLQEAFFRRMEEEGIDIETTLGETLMPECKHVAYFRGSPDGLNGYGRTAEDAYLALMEAVDDREWTQDA